MGLRIALSLLLRLHWSLLAGLEVASLEVFDASGFEAPVARAAILVRAEDAERVRTLAAAELAARSPVGSAPGGASCVEAGSIA